MNDKLPEAPKAAGNYVTVKKIGDFIYTSGHVPITDEKKIIGKIPNDISIEEGYDAASLCAELTIASLLTCLLYTSPSPRDRSISRMPSSA